jgi:hypothetical protein
MTSPSPLSSFSNNVRARLTGRNVALTLWGVVTLIGVVLIILLMHEPKPPRNDVASYISRVNTLSFSFSQDYKSIENAYRKFELAPTKPALQENRLKDAAAKLTSLRIEISQIQAPPDARELRRRLIAFFRQQEAVSQELLGVSTYVPRLMAAEKVLAPAGQKMGAALKSGASAAQQAAALGTYAAALDQAAGAIAAIEPPGLFRASHADQVQRLRRSAALTKRLSKALAANDKPALERTVKELGASSASAGAARTAIVSYNARVQKIRALGAKVERERVRLDKTLS